MKLLASPIGGSVPSFLRPPPLPAALDLLKDPLSVQCLHDTDLRALHLDLDGQAREISVKEFRVRMMLGKLQRAKIEVERAITSLQKVSRHRRRIYADFVREEYDCRSPLGKRRRVLADEDDLDATLPVKNSSLPPHPFVRRRTQGGVTEHKPATLDLQTVGPLLYSSRTVSHLILRFPPLLSQYPRPTVQSLTRISRWKLMSAKLLSLKVIIMQFPSKRL